MTGEVPNLWAAFTAKTARLEMIIVFLSIAMIVFAGCIAWPIVHGTPIHYIPPGGPGLSQSGTIPDATATDFASRWLIRRYTFLPTTLTPAHQDLMTVMHPQLGLPLQIQLDREATWVKEHNVASQLGIVEALVLRREATQVIVTVSAMRRIWVGKQALHDTEVRAEITVQATVPSTLNPAGLLVTQVAVAPALTPAQ